LPADETCHGHHDTAAGHLQGLSREAPCRSALLSRRRFSLGRTCPRRSPPGIAASSKAESALLFQGFLNDYDFLAYDHGPIIVAGDRATAQPQIRYRHKKTDKVIETKLAHAWWVRNGKAVLLEERYDVAQVQAFLKSLND